ncbi:hypothetical protein A2876_04660 [Candidatus Amesbacteria bacterium RIFCSPHIGHO2_01_FULL_48_32b]|uniref:Uncharacterized protein n=1 Tax=Candidatus Amesbacteria bacterium RIFCSPHIGHO2_01_FULL_48_32b TaxID=1797253 RepID=A0A1F4YD54_9BACT|nr:MAG: hypothetical protein A2876_04660 [Candidatus Amesbacteria bacterium RIFCSPHIGHO2_01_FULL_48_32b]
MDKKRVVKAIKSGVNAALISSFPQAMFVVDPFLRQNPFWELCFFSVLSLYGIYMELRPNETKEVVEFIKNHPNDFRREIVESEEFKKGFLLFADQYLKQRLETKKHVLREIFLGFTKDDDKQKFELERLNDCLMRITVQSLEYLLFLKGVVMPQIEKEIDEELKKDQYQKSDRSLEWWKDIKLVSLSVWLPVDKYFHENYYSDSPKVREKFGMNKIDGWPSDLLHRAQNLETETRNNAKECINELVSLGMLKIKVTGGPIGTGAASDYTMTRFGYKFLTYLELP